MQLHHRHSCNMRVKDGATEYLTKPISLDELDLMVERVLEQTALRRDHQFYKQRYQKLQSAHMLGGSPVMVAVNRLIDAVASSDMTVLIQGESGVGKELVAQELHRHSERADGNFVALDCCTLQENLFESELFGHERGAFTGADRMKRGLIEGAENGTLFLDEIGDIDPSIQAKLLRVLESGQFRRLGGTKDLKANVRIVTATNRRLDELTGDGRFRSGLYYRLSAFVIDVPPLRDRREDIAELVGHFIRNTDISHRNKKGASARVLKQLVEYDWPGNVRELKNVVERAIILAGDDSEIRPQHLTFAPGRSGNSSDVPFCEVGWVSHRSKVGSSFPVCCRAVRQSVRVYASGTC